VNYTIKKEKDYLVVFMSGEVDISITDSLRENIDRALQDYGLNDLIFDLSGVEFVDSAGLGVILGRYKKVAARGGKVYLAGAKPQVKKILELSGLLGLMSEYPSTGALWKKLD
jgi:stage II sporulation protein AA (anti-sigma F factor antagonist)